MTPRNVTVSPDYRGRGRVRDVVRAGSDFLGRIHKGLRVSEAGAVTRLLYGDVVYFSMIESMERILSQRIYEKQGHGRGRAA